MTPDYRAMCSHPLAQEAYVAFVQLCKGRSDDAGTYDADEEIVRRALKRLDELESALLAEAPAEGPSDPISELVSQCRPLEPEMAECLTPQARWQLYGDDAQPVAEPGEVEEGPSDEEIILQAGKFLAYSDAHMGDPARWEGSDVDLVAFTRHALSRWGRPAAAPVPEPSPPSWRGPMADRLYVHFASLEWKLGCHMAEWKAARELAYRMGKSGDELHQAHCDGVVRLLREYLESQP